MSGVQVIFVTIPDDDDVMNAVVRPLIDEHLAACVNVLPGVQSYYRWEGAVQHDRERLLLIKTSSERLDELTRRITQLHPYDVPEIIAADVNGGLGPYLQWVKTQSGLSKK